MARKRTKKKTTSKKKSKASKKQPAEERRSFQRVEKEHAVEVVGADGTSFEASAPDLSLSGMQLVCPADIAAKVQRESKDEYLTVRMRFRTADGGQVRVQVVCDVVSSKKLAGKKVRLGLKFVEFLSDSYGDLEAYIDEVIDLPD